MGEIDVGMAVVLDNRRWEVAMVYDAGTTVAMLESDDDIRVMSEYHLPDVPDNAFV